MSVDSEISTEEAEASSLVLSALKRRAYSMSGWLKFLGIVYIILGIPNLIVLVGALYIWLGVLLYQAGTAAQEGSDHALLRMMSKFKMYFIISAVLLGLTIAFLVLFFLIVGFAALGPLVETSSGIQV